MAHGRRNWLTTAAVLIGAPFGTSFGTSPLQAQAVSTGTQNAADVPGTSPENAAGVADIVVTATRQSQALSKVPISISAFTGQQMETLGIKSFAEVVRFTPGVQFNTERKDIAIRGISSAAGTGTTGLYIDDTPIQVRALGLNANNSQPIVFDLERIEVLRGPQGTLFGAGSEGGTVRYITPQPSLTKFSGYSRGEVAATQRGAPSFEVGQAVGGPIVTDRLGFRASAYYRRDGGYIDRIDSVTGAVTAPNANATTTLALRGALAWAPVDAVTVTPALFYQDRKQQQNDRYFVGPGLSHLVNGTPDRQADRDNFLLASLKLEADLGGVKLVSNSSYYTRKEVVNGYSGTLYNLSLFQQLLTNANPDGSTGQNFNLDPYTNPTQAASAAGYPLLTANGVNLPQFPNYVAQVFITNRQQNYTQEIRLQSSNPNARVSWTAGVFFQQTRQVSTEEINDPLLPQLVPALFGGDFLTFTEGLPLLANGDSYINSTTGKDRQIALFADATFALTERLKLTAGVRYAWTKYSFTNFADGPQNVGATAGSGGKSEHPFTPKAGINFQATPNDLYYATAAKGFRTGGANPPIPVQICAADLARLGKVPDTYAADNVWSYEVGTKKKLFDRRLSFAGSAYYLEWNNIQQASYLTSCGFQYTGNFGKVNSRGFDAQLNWAVVAGLDFDLAVGYTDAHYAKTTQVSPGLPPSTALDPNNLSTAGDAVPGVAPWTVAAGLQYNFNLRGNATFVRGDYEFRSRNRRVTPLQNPLSAVNDLFVTNDPATAQVNIRAGSTLHGILVEAFVDNLANVRPQLGLSHEDQFTALFEAQTARPRTFGLAASYRF